jgi:hypothetical protein
MNIEIEVHDAFGVYNKYRGGIRAGKCKAIGVIQETGEIITVNHFSPIEALQSVIDAAGERGPIQSVTMVNFDLIASVLAARSNGFG